MGPSFALRRGGHFSPHLSPHTTTRVHNSANIDEPSVTLIFAGAAIHCNCRGYGHLTVRVQLSEEVLVKCKCLNVLLSGQIYAFRVANELHVSTTDCSAGFLGLLIGLKILDILALWNARSADWESKLLYKGILWMQTTYLGTIVSCLSEVLEVMEKNLCPKHIVFEMSEEKQMEAKRFFYNKCAIPELLEQLMELK
ncbi:hypothetical protein EVAR_71830_1 [Eumeta japonica]|uniref:Uncharacterized protein n=1 Tax=Eumeta variegata TaxID=151549 RepID=A0A4C2AGV6_EUMVA|nr:hypothetical protein EVAR_71830_1 [Eumeta japonica]